MEEFFGKATPAQYDNEFLDNSRIIGVSDRIKVELMMVCRPVSIIWLFGFMRIIKRWFWGSMLTMPWAVWNDL